MLTIFESIKRKNRTTQIKDEQIAELQKYSKALHVNEQRLNCTPNEVFPW